MIEASAHYEVHPPLNPGNLVALSLLTTYDPVKPVAGTFADSFKQMRCRRLRVRGTDTERQKRRHRDDVEHDQLNAQNLNCQFTADLVAVWKRKEVHHPCNRSSMRCTDSDGQH